VVYDSPQKEKVENEEIQGRLMRRSVARAAAAVQSELLLVSPYIVPGEKGMQFIRKLRERGVRIRMLTNSLESTDVPLVHAAYMHYRISLLEDGVEIHEVRRKLGNPRGSGGPLKSAGSGRFSLHAKVIVFDRSRLFIGSMNLDRRSLRINTELGLIIDSPELARQVAARFDSIAQPANSYMPALRESDGGRPSLVWRTEQNGHGVELETEPARDAWQRLRVDFLSLLPLDDEL
jgi:putative cardiolipin synthase